MPPPRSHQPRAENQLLTRWYRIPHSVCLTQSTSREDLLQAAPIFHLLSPTTRGLMLLPVLHPSADGNSSAESCLWQTCPIGYAVICVDPALHPPTPPPSSNTRYSSSSSYTADCLEESIQSVCGPVCVCSPGPPHCYVPSYERCVY